MFDILLLRTKLAIQLPWIFWLPNAFWHFQFLTTPCKLCNLFVLLHPVLQPTVSIRVHIVFRYHDTIWIFYFSFIIRQEISQIVWRIKWLIKYIFKNTYYINRSLCQLWLCKAFQDYKLSLIKIIFSNVNRVLCRIIFMNIFNINFFYLLNQYILIR